MASPAPAPKKAGRTSSITPKAKSEDSKEPPKKKDAADIPSRPAGLQSSLLRLYSILGVAMLFFVFVGESMKHPIPEGKFEKKDGTLIDIADYDPVELGPYPKCHDHFEEHAVTLENGTTTWVKNKDAPSGGPYHVGHPENPEWEKRADELVKAENAENRFTWKGLQPQLHLPKRSYLA